MIDFNALEKVSEYKNESLNWIEGRDINAVYVILVGDEYYIGSSHYTYIRIRQHLDNLLKGTHHSGRFQLKFDAIKEFSVYILERGIQTDNLVYVEKQYIKKFQPTLNVVLVKRPVIIKKDEKAAELSGVTAAAFSELDDIINKSQIAKQYFGKSPSWFSQRVNGCLVLNKAMSFKEEEYRQLAEAFRDIAKRLNAHADEIDNAKYE